jgi:hypothetical protein
MEHRPAFTNRIDVVGCGAPDAGQIVPLRQRLLPAPTVSVADAIGVSLVAVNLFSNIPPIRDLMISRTVSVTPPTRITTSFLQ